MIERKKKFTIGKHSFVADFPNVGQIIDIESLKQALTSNRYGQMAMSGIESQYFALDIVDAISFYQVCAPAVANAYNISNYAELSYEDAKEIIEAYQKQIRPWYAEVMNELKGASVKENGGDTANNN